jgi:hypothetical protein
MNIIKSGWSLISTLIGIWNVAIGGTMKSIVVKSQAEYDEAQKLYQDALNESYFDIDRGRGMEIVEEVDYLIYNYLYKDESKENTEKNLAHFYFTSSQAEEITNYFITHRPSDLYEIERGLNTLNLYNDQEINTNASLIHIKDSIEPIRVRFPVEVFGNSVVEAWGHSKVIAHDNSFITARDYAIVEAHDSVQIEAFEHSHITARNDCYAILFDTATAAGYDAVAIEARDSSKAAVYNQACAEIRDGASVDAYNHAHVQGKDSSRITAYDDVIVNACDNSCVTAKGLSYIFAHGSATVNALDHSVVVAGNTVNVSAAHHALVFTRDNAVCNIKDKAQLITGAQNKPLFLKSNVLHLLDHPYINKEPVIAVNLLLAAANQKDKGDFSSKLKELGCIDPESTDRVLSAFVNDLNQKLTRTREKDPSRER